VTIFSHITFAYGGMARLSWPGWLVTYQGGLLGCR